MKYVKENVIKKIRELTTKEKLQFKNENEQEIMIYMSFKNFNDI